MHRNGQSRRPTRAARAVIVLIAVASCVTYAGYLAGLVSLRTVVGVAQLVFFASVAVVGVVAAFKYRSRRNNY